VTKTNHERKKMPPAVLALVFSLVEEAVKITPGLVTAFQDIFSKSNPTPDDWAALRAKVLAGSYADYVPDSDLQAALASSSDAAPIDPPVTVASSPAPAPIDAPAAPAAPAAAGQWVSAQTASLFKSSQG
jgi:hypothetical protein